MRLKFEPQERANWTLVHVPVCNSEAAISVYVRPLEQATREIAPRTEIRATGLYLIRNSGKPASPLFISLVRDANLYIKNIVS